MLTRTFIALFVCQFLFAGTTFAEERLAAHEDYIQRFKDIAIREMERSGVPASIKLAQGILESSGGESALARRANNHFGIKCGPNWKGDTFYQKDDDYNAEGQLIESCFRSYKNADASYIAHSEFLRDPQKAFRYGFLFRLDPQDYREWAYGLKRAGYATSATYPEKLISLIERYDLHRYDQMSSIDLETPTEIVASGILHPNDVRYVVVGEGESLEDIALRVDVSVRNLITFNDNITNPTTPLSTGQAVYVQPKRNSYRGRETYHRVEAGETMMSISQMYGVKLSKLLKRNRLNNGQEPATSEQIKLRGGKVSSSKIPKVRQPGQPDVPPVIVDPGPLELEEPEENTTTSPTTGNSGSNNSGTVRPQPEGGVIIVGGNRPTPNTGNTGTTSSPTTPGNNNSNPATSPPSSTTPQYYTVQSGDTLWSIAQRHGTTVDQIKALNGLNNNNISVGLKLRVQ